MRPAGHRGSGTSIERSREIAQPPPGEAKGRGMLRGEIGGDHRRKIPNESSNKAVTWTRPELGVGGRALMDGIAIHNPKPWSACVTWLTGKGGRDGQAVGAEQGGYIRSIGSLGGLTPTCMKARLTSTIRHRDGNGFRSKGPGKVKSV